MVSDEATEDMVEGMGSLVLTVAVCGFKFGFAKPWNGAKR
jgi:hypothetical protein